MSLEIVSPPVNGRPRRERVAKRLRSRGGPAFATLLTLTMVSPVIWMLISSFKTDIESTVDPPTLYPHDPTASAFTRVFNETVVPHFLLNSAMVAVGTTVLVLVLSVLAAYALVRFSLPGAEWITRSTLIFYSMPPILLVVPIVQMFVTLHLVDSLLGLVIVYTALYLPLGIWLLRGYFIGLDPSPEEAAQCDGTTKFGAFWRIGLPQSLPGVTIVAVFVFNAASNEYLYASVLLQSPEKQTMPAGLAQFISETSIYSWPMLMAAGLLGITPILVIYIFAQRRIVGSFSSL